MGELVGINWKQIHTIEAFKKADPDTPPKEISVIHVEGPLEEAHKICSRLSCWYGSASTEFLDGTKIRLTPIISQILSRDGKVKISTLIARQEAINNHLPYMKSWEFSTNLMLDKVSPNCQKSLRQVLLKIKSERSPLCSAFI